MIQNSKDSEQAAVLRIAQELCVAIRTAPKTSGIDMLESCIATGEELFALADKMDELGTKYGADFLLRDARNIRASSAVVLVGVKNHCRGMNEFCQYCGFENCAACTAAGGKCLFAPVDLGIAIGSAVSIAADHRVDNRVMYSVGRAAMDLGYLPEEYGSIIGIPLCVSGKSPYFDRKKST